MGQYFYLDPSQVCNLPLFITLSDLPAAFMSHLHDYLFGFGTNKAYNVYICRNLALKSAGKADVAYVSHLHWDHALVGLF